MRFSDIVNPTVRFGFMINPTVGFGVVRFSDTPYGPARLGSPLSRFFYGVVSTHAGKTVQHALSVTVHRIYKPY